MEGSSSRPSDSDRRASGASKFLSNLPSRGLLSSTVSSSNLGSMRVYICDHDTSPPEDQQIKTNQQNILIRALTLKKLKRDSSAKEGKGTAPSDRSRKRAAEKALDSRTSAKKASNGSQQEGLSSHLDERDYHSMTVERLRAFLKEKGLPTRGKKDELVARLKSANI